MPKIGMRDTREQQFIDAAMTVIGESGLHNASNARIARQAGLSASLLPHYFPDRPALLAGVFRQLLREHRTRFLLGYAKATSPRDRLECLIATYFHPSLFTPEMKTVWQDLYHASHHTPGLKRIDDAHQARLRSVVRAELRRLVSPRHLEAAAIGFIALLQGLWLRGIGDSAPFCKQAQDLQRHYLKMITMQIRVKAGDHLR